MRQPTVDRFADVMAGHAAGVAVVTLGVDGEPRGLAVTSLAAYSATPPSIMVAIAHSSRSHRFLAGCEAFGAHLLSVEQRAVADVFASRVDEKFEALEWDWDDGVPRLRDVRAYLRCRREATFTHGDHSIIVGGVEAIASDVDQHPLVYWQRQLSWRLMNE